MCWLFVIITWIISSSRSCSVLFTLSQILLIYIYLFIYLFLPALMRLKIFSHYIILSMTRCIFNYSGYWLIHHFKGVAVQMFTRSSLKTQKTKMLILKKKNIICELNQPCKKADMLRSQSWFGYFLYFLLRASRLLTDAPSARSDVKLPTEDTNATQSHF